MKRNTVILFLSIILVASSALFVPGIGIAASETRTVSIDTQEITRPDVAVSPDGDWLVFTALYSSEWDRCASWLRTGGRLEHIELG